MLLGWRQGKKLKSHETRIRSPAPVLWMVWIRRLQVITGSQQKLNYGFFFITISIEFFQSLNNLSVWAEFALIAVSCATERMRLNRNVTIASQPSHRSCFQMALSHAKLLSWWKRIEEQVKAGWRQSDQVELLLNDIDVAQFFHSFNWCSRWRYRLTFINVL